MCLLMYVTHMWRTWCAGSWRRTYLSNVHKYSCLFMFPLMYSAHMSKDQQVTHTHTTAEQTTHIWRTWWASCGSWRRTYLSYVYVYSFLFMFLLMVVSRCRGIGPPSSGIVIRTLFLLAADLRRHEHPSPLYCLICVRGLGLTLTLRRHEYPPGLTRSTV